MSDTMKALDEIEAALAEAETELKVAFEALGEFANILSREPYEANRAYDAMSDMQAASRCIPTLRAALVPPADEPGWLKGMDEASAVREITAQMGVPPADDEIGAIRARHEAADKDSGYEWARLYANQAHADRATLLLAFTEAQERAERAERNRDMWKGQCERQAERLTVLNHAVAEISRGVQSGVDPQASIERLVTIARNAAPEIVSSELPAAQTLKERNDV